MKLIKENKTGKVYQNNDFKIFYRVKNSISGDNDINPYEKFYLISGEIELTIGNKTEKIIAPAEFEIPENTYHKILGLTDIIFVLMNN